MRRSRRAGIRLCIKAMAIMGVVAALLNPSQPTSAQTPRITSKPAPLLNGVDVSWLPAIEQAGSTFRDSTGQPTDPLTLLRDAGLRVARVRLWVNPPTPHGGFDEVLALGQRIKRAGLLFCLDLHYSDWWADPGKQTTPAAWSRLSAKGLEKKVSDYTKQTVTALAKAGARPDWVQIGNEVTYGLLWPTGHVSDVTAMVRLLNAGISAAKAASNSSKTLIHLDTGGDASHTDAWLTAALAAGLRRPDALGVSYYSQWHGPLSGLSDTITLVTARYKWKLFIAETAYPNTAAINPLNASAASFAPLVLKPRPSEIQGYPLSPIGQAGYVDRLATMVRAAPAKRGLGIWWWEGFSPNLAQLSADFDAAGIWNSSLVDSAGMPQPAMAALGQ